ncbi:unnamed protein product [Acanthoscelides obtectus]|uniref:Uncharacterized protein n=1 Tax=Acanthoscelides obtectus TaxID=200917 RepID=A0A9P0QGR9_ACAOB|nr:unnamed protein product [Acanthoscelides obtectus]CAK1683738.1 hypothetical protein AOBTE_LOCUS34433 [Acanthoscelides obtectus]
MMLHSLSHGLSVGRFCRMKNVDCVRKTLYEFRLTFQLSRM